MKLSPRVRILIGVTLLAIIGYGIWWYTKPATEMSLQKKSGAGQTFDVKVTHPEVKPMPVSIQAVGNVEAEQSANIVAQVSGVLQKIDFTQGEQVQPGQLLFEIDPSVYASDVMQAKANLQRDKSQLALLQSTAERYSNLAKLEYVTRQAYDEALAAVQEQLAVVSADQAILDQKQILLGYANIKSPIAGKAGIINVHPGELITANSATPLVVINQLGNVLVNFYIPQNRLQELLAYQRAGTLKVIVYAENGEDKLAQGQLAFVGNTVNEQTGTVQVKARAANADFALWPGQLVTVRLILTMQPNALVIPSVSVQMGQAGQYVYVVRDNKAMVQPITVAREIGNQSIVASGLKLDDTVLTEVPPGLTDGSLVRIGGKTP